jgi:hypothetical protein
MRFVHVLVAMTISSTVIACKPRKQSDDLKGIDDSTEEYCQFGEATGVTFGSSEIDSLDLSTWKTISSLAHASEAAYLEPGAIRERALAWGYPNVEHFMEGSMYAYLMTNDRCAVLVFRGTDMKSLRDWLVNIDAVQERVDHGKIHAGFYQAASSLHRKIVRALNRSSVSRKIFWVTGHSLGGALAGIFAYKSKFERVFGDGPEMHKIVTFGQPLFANRDLAAKLRNTFVRRYYRVVNASDLVARVPFWMTHFGSLVWLRDGEVDFRPDQFLVGGGPGSSGTQVLGAEIPPELSSDEAAYREFLEQTKGLPMEQLMPDQPRVMGGPGWPQFIDDHFMGNYIRRISAEINER